MCAINPTHKKRFILDVYTSDPRITEADFLDVTIERAVRAEQLLNLRSDMRWHIKQTDQPAD